MRTGIVIELFCTFLQSIIDIIYPNIDRTLITGKVILMNNDDGPVFNGLINKLMTIVLNAFVTKEDRIFHAGAAISRKLFDFNCRCPFK